jgi:hypothetical protein
MNVFDWLEYIQNSRFPVLLVRMKSAKQSFVRSTKVFQ